MEDGPGPPARGGWEAPPGSRGSSREALYSAQTPATLKKVLWSSLPEIVSGRKVPEFQFLSFITSDPQRLINLELFHSGVFPKQLG